MVKTKDSTTLRALATKSHYFRTKLHDKGNQLWCLCARTHTDTDTDTRREPVPLGLSEIGSYSPGWSHTCSIVQGNLEVVILLLLSTGITGVDQSRLAVNTTVLFPFAALD